MATAKKNVQKQITNEEGLEDLQDLTEVEDELEVPDLASIASSGISSTDWTVETIVYQIQKGNLDLSPEFQRRFAWSDKRRSQFIESLVLRYPVPQIVLAQELNRPGKFIVLDGKQRLMTLAQFFGLKNIGQQALELSPLKLSNLTIKKGWNGHTYSSILKDPVLRGDITALENTPIRSVVITSWGSEEFLYSVFVRLNQGSLSLSPQELRQALKPGPFTEYVERYSASSDGLRVALGLSKPDFRMRDVELLTRYLAFQFRHNLYKGNLKKFLDDTCEKFNKGWASDKNAIVKECKNFERVVTSAKGVFGDREMFRKFTGKSYEKRLNRAVFDVVAFALADKGVRSALLIEANRIALKKGFEVLCKKSAFRSSIETTTKSIEATKTRFGLFLDLVEGVTGVRVAFKLR